MKKGLKISAVIVFVILSIISYWDIRIYREKQRLYVLSSMYDEELVAYSKLLMEKDKLEVKYRILRSRHSYDVDDEKTLKDVELFLKKSEKIENKFKQILADYNLNAAKYNALNKQIIWYKNSLPKELSTKAEEDYL
ncbi:MAG: hypothetical protein JSW26_24995 [Desulfobacterales bacterium]|nr:MAG: hypothetical protein JSW26_24995 [Desulfobacterales bacterium]